MKQQINDSFPGVVVDPSRVIQKKRDGQELSSTEIKSFINGLLTGSVKEYQMTALLMAIYLKGMTHQETANLTDAMLYSGKVLEFNDPTIIDKHSTGGIGDKTTFILAPIAAACGVKVPSIAGRGLGHTGGTVDKIEAIPGFQTDISLDRFQDLLIKNNLVLIGQTKEFAPADRIVYGLRDVTATVDSIPLITASIMGKKLAEGISGIVLDVKTGPGAFMKEQTESVALAKSLLNTAIRFKKKGIAFISDMSQPLGKAVGNSLEMIESIEVLKGHGPEDLKELSIEIAAAMIYLAQKSKTIQEGKEMAKSALKDGSAFEKFKLMIKEQNGDTSYIDDPSLIKVANKATIVTAPIDGYLESFQNDEVGHLLTELGGGRKIATDKIDHSVGFIFHTRIGDKIKKDQPLLTIYHHENQQGLASNISDRFTKEVIRITTKKVQPPPLIYDIIETGEKDNV